MKIHDAHGYTQYVHPNTQPLNRVSSDAAAGTRQGSGPAEDRVELSERAKALAVAQESLGQLAPTRTERVQELQQAIQRGRYCVPGEQIAARLLAEGFVA